MRKYLSIAAIVLVILLLALFTFGAFVGIVGPRQGSADFGMTVTDVPGELFYRVFLSRNLVIIAVALVFLLQRNWKALAIVITACIALPIFDASVLYLQLGSSAPLAFHLGTICALSIISILLWLHCSWQNRVLIDHRT